MMISFRPGVGVGTTAGGLLSAVGGVTLVGVGATSDEPAFCRHPARDDSTRTTARKRPRRWKKSLGECAIFIGTLIIPSARFFDESGVLRRWYYSCFSWSIFGTSPVVRHPTAAYHLVRGGTMVTSSRPHRLAV